MSATEHPFLRRFCLFVTLVLLLSTTGFSQVVQLAPLNPDFVKYRESGLKTGEVNYGLLPSPIDMSYLRGQPIPPQFSLRATLPAVYDLRALGRVTSVKNQNPYGTCWAHATFGSMESCLLPSENRNFSENNLVNLAGFDPGFNSGGNIWMSMAYLTRWSGPVNEVDDPYPNPYNSPAGLPVQKHVQETRIIPGKASPTANTLIKQALLDYGAVYVSYYHNDGYFNQTYNTYRYTGPFRSGNHAVTLVGWNDNFDRSKFAVVPPGNGAYIVKNSWGTSWGENGYFYVSYYDTVFGYDAICSFHNAEDTDNYGTTYSYDPLGCVGSIGTGTTTTCWGANVFTADATGEIDAVGVYSLALNSSYTLYVYTGVSPGAPRSGTVAATKTGTFAYPGYQTIDLDAPVEVATGQRFSVVLRLTTPGYGYPVPVEYAQANYSSAATAAAGQSYASVAGNAWDDVTSIVSNGNACIKAYTVAVSGSNDSFANRITIPSSGATVSGTNVGATKESGEPDHAGNSGGASVWWSWTPSVSGRATIHTAGSSFDTLLAVYTGSSIGGLSLVVCNDDAVDLTSQVTFPATAGTSYQIAVDGYDGATGSILLTVTHSRTSRGDLNQDGQADLIWQCSKAHSVAAWLMDSATSMGSAVTLCANPGKWVVVGTGDLDSDGSTDIVWQCGDSVAAWLMDGLTFRESKMLTSRAGGWHVAAIGDLNNDGIDDIVWQNKGSVAVWLMDGHTNMQNAVTLTTKAGTWSVRAVVDISKDGKTDILWQSGSTAAAWLMDGPNSMLAAPILSANTGGWCIVGSADYDNNGSSDIVWQCGGKVALWLIDGYDNLISAPMLTPNCGSWVVVGPR